VVGHDFQSVNLRFTFFRFLVRKFSQSLLQRVRKDALAVFRAPHKVILERENRPSVDSVPMINHDWTRSSYEISVKNLIKEQTDSPAS
jgi:hypothetical protein